MCSKRLSGNGDDTEGDESTEIRVLDGGQKNGDANQQRLERTFRTLASTRRRYILYELQDREVSDLDELARSVAAMERKISPEEVDPDDVDRLKIRLIHADIPQLEDAGFVEYDHRSRTICYSYPRGVLDRILRLCASVDAP